MCDRCDGKIVLSPGELVDLIRVGTPRPPSLGDLYGPYRPYQPPTWEAPAWWQAPVTCTSADNITSTTGTVGFSVVRNDDDDGTAGVRVPA